jgi:hypothetical protein
MLFGSRLRLGNTTGKHFYFDGHTVKDLEGAPPRSAVLYKEISMYYSAGHFFIVPYDAIANQIGNGRQVEGVVGSDEENLEDAEEEDDAPPDPTTVDWSVLSFHWKGEGTFNWFKGPLVGRASQCGNVRCASLLSV